MLITFYFATYLNIYIFVPMNTSDDVAPHNFLILI